MIPSERWPTPTPEDELFLMGKEEHEGCFWVGCKDQESKEVLVGTIESEYINQEKLHKEEGWVRVEVIRPDAYEVPVNVVLIKQG